MHGPSGWQRRAVLGLMVGGSVSGALAAPGPVAPASPGGATAAAPAPTASGFDDWAQALATAWVQADPSSATLMDYLPADLQRQAERELTPYTPAARAARVALARDGLPALARWRAAPLSASQRLSARLIQIELEAVIEGQRFADLEHPFQQMGGAHLRVVETLTRFHPLRHRDDVDNYLTRLAQVGPRLDEATAWAASLEAKGHRMPRANIEAALSQFERFLAPAAADNVLVSTLRTRSAALAGVSGDERAAWLQRAEALVRDAVQPAYRRAQALLREQLPRSAEPMGLAWRPDGEAAYAFALRRHTSTRLSAAAIHAIGRREVARIEAEMDALLRQLGHTEGSVSARLQALNATLQPPAEPDPRPALLARYQAWVDDAERRSREVFNLRPQARCEVRREPAVTEATAAARYTPPANDGSRPGIFWRPLPGPSFNLVGMRTLTYHEAIPGHHFQVALVKELPDLPAYRRSPVFGWYTAYGEGWALYAEQLAVELGWYGDDAIGRLGQLDAALFRARRLVVDTGLHAMKWTREQAIAYGIPPHEVDRYAVWPGQATGYMIGLLRILEIRDRARQALGERFALKDFHDVVLAAGRVPLDVLEELVDAWVAERLAASRSV